MPEKLVRFSGCAAQKPVAGAATAWVQADKDGHASCIVEGWSLAVSLNETRQSKEPFSLGCELAVSVGGR